MASDSLTVRLSKLSPFLGGHYAGGAGLPKDCPLPKWRLLARAEWSAGYKIAKAKHHG